MVEFEYLGTCFFFYKTPGIFIFYCIYGYPWKFQKKQCFTSKNSTNCVTPFRNSKAKTLDIPHIFGAIFFFTLEIPLHLYLIAGISTFFLQCTWKFHVLTPLVWIFAGTAQLFKSMSATVHY